MRVAGHAPRFVLFALAVALGANVGCQTTGVRALSVVGLEKPPVVFAVVVDDQPLAAAAQFISPFSRYEALREQLSRELDRPVTIDACFPIQVQSGLESGWYQFAILTPAQLARLPQILDNAPLLAAPVDLHGRTLRPALLVVRQDSPFRKPEDLRHKVIAFGPVHDSRTHHAALQMLTDAGLTKGDLALDALPIPGSLRHIAHGRDVATSVINQGCDAGFIDELAWESLPEVAVGNEPGRDQLRIIGHTADLPSRVVVGSSNLEPGLRERLENFLHDCYQKHPEALQALNITRYAAVGYDVRAACRELRLAD